MLFSRPREADRSYAFFGVSFSIPFSFININFICATIFFMVIIHVNGLLVSNWIMCLKIGIICCTPRKLKLENLYTKFHSHLNHLDSHLDDRHTFFFYRYTVDHQDTSFCLLHRHNLIGLILDMLVAVNSYSMLSNKSNNMTLQREFLYRMKIILMQPN